MKHTAAELRALEKRGESKTNWKAAAKKPLPSGRDADDAMDEIDWLATELPKPQRKGHMTLRIDSDVPGSARRVKAISRGSMRFCGGILSNIRGGKRAVRSAAYALTIPELLSHGW